MKISRRRAWLQLNWAVAILLMLAILAAGLRLWQLHLLPPGLYYDEAINGLDARRLLSGFSLPIYFSTNNGREPLYVYLQALSVLAFGPTAYALRLVSALAGVLTVLAVYDGARTILSPAGSGTFDTEKGIALGRWIALVAAASMAVSFWHLSLSRLAFRAILLPLFSILAVSAFWRGWHGWGQRHYLLAGAWMALAFYTYTAARLLPLVLLLFVAVEMVVDVARMYKDWRGFISAYRPRVRGLLLLGLVALVLLLPLLWVLADDPSLLLGRAGQVSIFTTSQRDVPGTALQRFRHNLVVTLRSFYDSGDQNPRHNLPGRAVNDLLLASLFTLGWLVALYHSLKQPRYRLLLIWLLVMLMPTVLSDLAPHSLRGAGAMPSWALLTGAGGGFLLQRATRLAILHRAGATILVLVVLVSGSITAYDYFFRWATLDRLGGHFDLEQYLAADVVADWLDREDDEQDFLLLSQALYQAPQMQFAVGTLPRGPIPAAIYSPAEKDVEIRIVRVAGSDPAADGRQAMFLLHNGAGIPTATWLEPLSASDEQFFARTVQSGSRTVSEVHWPLERSDWPYLHVLYGADESLARLPEPRQIPHRYSATFANGMELLGYNVVRDTMPRTDLPAFRLIAFWRRTAETDATEPEKGAVHAFVHLYQDGLLSQDNGPLRNRFPVLLWPPGEVVESRHYLPIPQASTSGKAYFEVGLYKPGSAEVQRIGIVDDRGQETASQVDLGGVMIGAEPSEVASGDLHSIGVQFGGGIELIGWKVYPDPADLDYLQVELGWRALDRPSTDFTAFVHLLDQAGEIVDQYDQPPGGLENPTSLWVPNERIRTTFTVPVPSEEEAAYKLRIGLYEPVSGRQSPITTVASSVVSSMIAAPGDTFVLLPLDGTAY